MKKTLMVLLFISLSTSGYAQLSYKGRYKEYEAGMSGISLVQPVCFSPDGKNCYVGSYNGFTWYAVNYATQSLEYKGTLVDGGDGGPGVSDGHGVIVSPDGKFVYLAAGAGEHSISVYTRNTTTGAPTYKEIIRDGDMGISNMKYPYGIDMDKDGKNIYLACKDWDGNSIIWFSRNATTGSLTYMGKFVDGSGVDGLLSADDVALSPDGKNVYVTAFGDDAITWYSRDLTTGALTYGGMLKDNTGGVDGLDNPYWVEISADGKFAYVGAQDDNSIAWFSRNASTGALTYVNRVTDGVVLSGTRGLSLHPSGNWLFASSAYASTVSWYAINTTTGALTYAGHHKNGVLGVDGIGGTRYNGISPNGNLFVATGYDENSVA